MDTLRGYLSREIYGATLFVFLAFLGLFAFFDLINELNTVGHGNYKFGLAVLRVALQTPSRFYEIIPVAARQGARPDPRITVYSELAARCERAYRVPISTAIGNSS